MEFGPILSEDEALKKKAVRPEEYDKIKRINRLREDDLNYSTSKSVGREFKKYGNTCLWVIITPLLILFLWLPPKIPTCMSHSLTTRGGNCRTVKNGFRV
jgi:hypothetical protein